MILPTVSVIVLNYNGLVHLEECFSSLMKTCYPSNKLELLFIDNNSKDSSAKFVRDNYKQVKVIETGMNSGWSIGNNIGAKNAKGELIFFLNNDVKVDKNWLLPLVLTLRNKKIGAVSPKCLFMDSKDKVNSVGVFFSFFGVSGAIGKNKDNIDFQKNIEIFGPTGVCFGINKNLFFEIGELIDHYFMYMEDVEFGWRLKNLGLKSVCNTKSIIFHKGHGSRYDLFYRNTFRNTFWMITKNSPYLLILPLLFTLACSTFVFSMNLFSKKSPDSFQPIQGLFDALFSFKSFNIIINNLKNPLRGINGLYGINRTLLELRRINMEH